MDTQVMSKLKRNKVTGLCSSNVLQVSVSIILHYWSMQLFV